MAGERNREHIKPYKSGSIDASMARDSMSDTINRVSYGKERIVIRRHGKELAALVPIEDLRFLEELEDRLDLEDARAALAEAEKEGTIPWEKIKKDLGL
jgi:prevent-host-death family protein